MKQAARRTAAYAAFAAFAAFAVAPYGDRVLLAFHV